MVAEIVGYDIEPKDDEVVVWYDILSDGKDTYIFEPLGSTILASGSVVDVENNKIVNTIKPIFAKPPYYCNNCGYEAYRLDTIKDHLSICNAFNGYDDGTWRNNAVYNRSEYIRRFNTIRNSK